MNQSNPTVHDARPIDISKCRVRRDSSVIAECVVERVSCPRVVHIRHTSGLIKLCIHPCVDQITEASG